MKKKSLLIIIILLFSLGLISLLYRNNSVTILKEESRPKKENVLSMMLETKYNSGEYENETRSAWPTKAEGYKFNKTLSKCEKGSTLSWDEEKEIVVMEGISSDKCYVYFDVYLTLYDYVINSYPGYPSGQGVLYHTWDLEAWVGSSAVDSSYRYYGENPSNYICFGSDEEVCPTDNLYRIIGVFTVNNRRATKVIKYDYTKTDLLGSDGDYANTCNSVSDCNSSTEYKGNNSLSDIGTYYWNLNNSGTTSYFNTWHTSSLLLDNLNTNFLNNIGEKWSDKITPWYYKIGGNTYSNIVNKNAQDAYTNEITSPSSEVTNYMTTKIGLMYVSDYAFAAEHSTWSDLSSYGTDEVRKGNWMYMGLWEWTMTRVAETSNNVFTIGESGEIMSYYMMSASGDSPSLPIRPVFYIASNVYCLSGKGTLEDPIRLS